MIPALQYFRALLGTVISDEAAQDAFEYVLVVGGVTVAVILAIATPVGTTLIDATVEGTCDAIATIPRVDPDCASL